MSPLPMSILIETDRLILRPIAARDWPAFRDYSLSERAKLSAGSDSVGGAWTIFAHFVGHWGVRGFGPLVFVPRGGRDIAAGVTGPYFPADWPEVEIGWQIWDAALEGQGYASEAVVAARAWCAETFGWTRMVSYIKPGNTRSEKLAQRIGCTLDDTAQRRPDNSPVWRHPAP